MIKYSRAVLVAAMAAAALAGCGSDDDGGGGAAATPSTTAAAKGKAVDIAYVSYNYTDYTQAEEAGMKKAVAAAGGSVKVYNANFDPQKLQQQCADAVSSRRYDVIALAPVNAPTAVPCVTAAKAAGVPVISVETPAGADPNAVKPTLPGVVGAVVQGPEASAEGLLPIVQDACKDANPCQILSEEVPGDPFTTTTNKLVAAKVPNAKIVQKFNGQYDPSIIAKLVPDALSAHPDADVLLTAADSDAIAALPGVKAAGLSGKIKVIGAGGSRQGAKAVADGTMFGTVGAWPVQVGQLVGAMATKAVNGEAIAETGVNSLALDQPAQVTKATVSQFTPEWGAKG